MSKKNTNNSNSDPVDMKDLSDDVKSKLRDFDEDEAYLLLCEIFSYAQATKNYARFQSDLNEWKRRYPIDLFSDDLKRKTIFYNNCRPDRKSIPPGRQRAIWLVILRRQACASHHFLVSSQWLSASLLR